MELVEGRISWDGNCKPPECEGVPHLSSLLLKSCRVPGLKGKTWVKLKELWSEVYPTALPRGVQTELKDGFGFGLNSCKGSV